MNSTYKKKIKLANNPTKEDKIVKNNILIYCQTHCEIVKQKNRHLVEEKEKDNNNNNNT